MSSILFRGKELIRGINSEDEYCIVIETFARTKKADTNSMLYAYIFDGDRETNRGFLCSRKTGYNRTLKIDIRGNCRGTIIESEYNCAVLGAAGSTNAQSIIYGNKRAAENEDAAIPQMSSKNIKEFCLSRSIKEHGLNMQEIMSDKSDVLRIVNDGNIKRIVIQGMKDMLIVTEVHSSIKGFETWRNDAKLWVRKRIKK